MALDIEIGNWIMATFSRARQGGQASGHRNVGETAAMGKRQRLQISLGLIFLRMFRLKSLGPPKKRISDRVMGMP